MQTRTKAEAFAEWDEWGEDHVRTKFNLGEFGNGGNKYALVKMWLDQKYQDRLDRLNRAADALSSENLRVTRSAKNAAWMAATMAIVAAIAAIVSAVITYLSLHEA